MNLSEIKENPNNPRVIEPHKFAQLVESLRSFPKMMALRPIIKDDNGFILGGNMRYRALLDLGYEQVPDEWVKNANDFTEEEKREFLIKDNLGFGEWNFHDLEAEWNKNELGEWGFDIPSHDSDLSKFFENDSEPTKVNQKAITLHFVIEDYEKVRKALDSMEGTDEKVIWNLLGLEK
jgi:ParB-like chromosome segregation protein Spo0J